MAIDFTKILVDFKGQPLKDGEVEANLGSVVVNALMANYNDDANGKEKLRRYKLALRIHDSTIEEIPIELKAEEIALCKDLIGKAFNPIVVGQAYMLLDGAENA